MVKKPGERVVRLRSGTTMFLSAPVAHDLRNLAAQLSFAVLAAWFSILAYTKLIGSYVADRSEAAHFDAYAAASGTFAEWVPLLSIAVLTSLVVGLMLIVPAPVRRHAPRVAVMAAAINLILAPMVRILNVVTLSGGLAAGFLVGALALAWLRRLI
jgi:hypothetical protein